MLANGNTETPVSVTMNLLGLAKAALIKNPRLLSRLSPCERDVIVLAIGSEAKLPCSCEEISEILKLRLNLVRRVRCRAIVNSHIGPETHSLYSKDLAVPSATCFSVSEDARARA